jgi:hypothetical protein
MAELHDLEVLGTAIASAPKVGETSNLESYLAMIYAIM